MGVFWHAPMERGGGGGVVVATAGRNTNSHGSAAAETFAIHGKS